MINMNISNNKTNLSLWVLVIPSTIVSHVRSSLVGFWLMVEGVSLPPTLPSLSFLEVSSALEFTPMLQIGISSTILKHIIAKLMMWNVIYKAYIYKV